MSSERKYIELKNPCSVKWDDLSGCGSNRFCQSCSTPVVDLTTKSSDQIIDFVMRSEGRICGRIRKSQVDRIIQSQRSNKPILKTFLFFILGFAVVTDAHSEKIATPLYNKVIEHESPIPNQTFNTLSHARSDSTILISGTVVDDNQEALPGVTIYFKGTSIGTQTDLNGKFAFEADSETISKKQTLVFTCIGFKATELQLEKTFQNLRVMLELEVIWLGEIRSPWYHRLWWKITSPFKKN